MAKDVDWNGIRCEYVTGAMSYKALAKKHRIQPNTLSKRGKEEGWPEQRRKFRDDVAARAIEGAADKEAARLANVIKSADAMGEVMARIFEDADQFHRHIVIDGRGASEERMFDKIDTRAIRDLTGAMKDMTFVLRNLHNLPTQAEKEAQRIAAERLNMDKRKADLDENTDRTITVVMPGEGTEEFAK